MAPKDQRLDPAFEIVADVCRRISTSIFVYTLYRRYLTEKAEKALAMYGG